MDITITQALDTIHQLRGGLEGRFELSYLGWTDLNQASQALSVAIQNGKKEFEKQKTGMAIYTDLNMNERDRQIKAQNEANNVFRQPWVIQGARNKVREEKQEAYRRGKLMGMALSRRSRNGVEGANEITKEVEKQQQLEKWQAEDTERVRERWLRVLDRKRESERQNGYKQKRDGYRRRRQRQDDTNKYESEYMQDSFETVAQNETYQATAGSSCSGFFPQRRRFCFEQTSNSGFVPQEYYSFSEVSTTSFEPQIITKDLKEKYRMRGLEEE